MGRHHRGRPGEPQGEVSEMIARLNAEHREWYGSYGGGQSAVDSAEETVPDIIEKQREIMRTWRW